MGEKVEGTTLVDNQMEKNMESDMDFLFERAYSCVFKEF